LKNLLALRRLGALAGIAFIVVFIVGSRVEGSTPNLTATAANVTSYYTSHHSKILIGDVLISAAFVLLVIWAAVLAGELRAAGRHAGAGALLASVTGGAAVALVASAVDIGVDQAAVRSTDPGFIRGGDLVDAYLGGVLPFLFLAAAAAATALAARALFPAWYVWLTGLVAVLEILGGISVKVSGFFNPLGGAPAISALALAVWVLATSVLLSTPRAAANAEAGHAAATGQAANT
jgi:hypothetical protein